MSSNLEYILRHKNQQECTDWLNYYHLGIVAGLGTTELFTLFIETFKKYNRNKDIYIYHTIFECAFYGNADNLKLALECDFGDVHNDENNYNNMSIAARRGYLHILKELKESLGIPLGQDVIRGAAANGHLDVVEWLYNNYPNQHMYLNEALEVAAKNNNKSIVNFILSKLK